MQTEWHVTPSLPFEAVCFINLMLGDPFYVDYYPQVYAHFEPQITPAAQAALQQLKQVMKDEQQQIVSATLALYFSATDAQTIEEMIAWLDQPDKFEAAFQATPYYEVDSWQAFTQVMGAVRTLLHWLQEIDFPGYWRENFLPEIEARRAEIIRDLPQYDVVPPIEHYLGHPLTDRQITIFLLHFNKPHGIKVVGTRFITATTWKFEINVRVAVHEMMHPPCDFKTDAGVLAALDTLKQDPFLQTTFQNHDPKWGYNSFEGFIEEACVQALDQVINETLGVAQDARQRWRDQDEGMHVFAPIVYTALKAQPYSGTFRDFLVAGVQSGRLLSVEAQHRDFYAI